MVCKKHYVTCGDCMAISWRFLMRLGWFWSPIFHPITCLFLTFTSFMNPLTISMMFVSVILLSFWETYKQWFYSIWYSRRFLFPVVTVNIFMRIIIGFYSEKMIITWDGVFDVWCIFLRKSLSLVSWPQLIKSTSVDVCLCLLWPNDFVPGIQCFWKRLPPWKTPC